MEAANARKRRILRRKKQRSCTSSPLQVSQILVSDEGNKAIVDMLDSDLKRSRSAYDNEPAAESTLTSVCAEESERKKLKPHITGIKKDARYDPLVPMTKEELKAWRKEARRVRNRESAAASRKKNKEAIQKLEIELETIKAKYEAALRHITGQPRTADIPIAIFQDVEILRSGSSIFSSASSISQNGKYSSSSTQSSMSSSVSANCPITAPNQGHHQSSQESSQQNVHITNVISRPIACV